VKQREMFRIQHGGGTGVGQGGVLATGGNLIFQGSHDRELVAYRATDGERLWGMPIQTFAPGGPISYAVDGVQYVAINAGGGGGQGTADIVRSDGRLLVFKLGGTASLPPMPEQPAETTEASLAAPAAPMSVEAVEGGRLYAQTCALCHGQNAIGEGVAPDLRRMTADTHDAFLDIVLRGARLDKGMANFSAILTEPQAAAIHAYIRSQTPELDDGHE
jgi:quinohemoprotein ethanol dehydrogenase